VPDLAATLATLTDSLAMRRAVLEALTERAEAAYFHRRSLDIEAPDRHALIVAVLTEAVAYWELESAGMQRPNQPVPTLNTYRELAADTYRLTDERIPSLLADTLDRT
jgi:hypothetical protein